MMMFVFLMSVLLIMLWVVAFMIRLTQYILAEKKYRPLYDKAYNASWDAVKFPRPSSGVPTIESIVARTKRHDEMLDGVGKWCDSAGYAYFKFLRQSFVTAAFQVFRPIYTQAEIDAFTIPFDPDKDDILEAPTIMY